MASNSGAIDGRPLRTTLSLHQAPTSCQRLCSRSGRLASTEEQVKKDPAPPAVLLGFRLHCASAVEADRPARCSSAGRPPRLAVSHKFPRPPAPIEPNRPALPVGSPAASATAKS